MKSDWNRVKEQTLWDYEDLIKKLQVVLAYDFVQEHYNHTMKQAQGYAKKLRWGLPFKTPLREFIDTDNVGDARHLDALKKQKIGSNLDLLEAGRTKAGQVQLSLTTEIPLAFVDTLMHKADISRLAYVRGKTVKYLCGGGYDSLEKIATANLPEMEEKMDAYYRTLGKSLADFRSVIPLSWMIGGAKILPRVVKV
jgi:hypothetical protein